MSAPEPLAPPFADPAFAKAASDKAAEARTRRAALPAEKRAMDRLERAAEDLVSELLDAAKGRGDYSGLSPADRLKATIKALEYSVGRPVPATTSTSKPDVPTADGLFG